MTAPFFFFFLFLTLLSLHTWVTVIVQVPGSVMVQSPVSLPAFWERASLQGRQLRNRG